MKNHIVNLIRSEPPSNCCVVPDSLPIPFFGKYDTAHVATISLNPSHQEFLDKKGNWLTGTNRRFESLASLQAAAPNELSDSQIGKVIERCYNYFENNGAVYWTWFAPLEKLFNPHELSYGDGSLVHLDLSPWATRPAWGKLAKNQRSILQENGAPFLTGVLVKHNVELLVANGVTAFESVAKTLKVPDSAVKITTISKKWRFFEADCVLASNKALKLIGWNLYLQRSGSSDAQRAFLASHLAGRSFKNAG